jgi:hypothetical protein
MAVQELDKAMIDHLNRRNRTPKSFMWRTVADLILGKVARLCKRISICDGAGNRDERIVILLYFDFGLLMAGRLAFY